MEIWLPAAAIFHATLHAAVGMTAVVAAFPAMVACPAATVVMTAV